jgi:peptidyl-prolyl cis-trans isomerase SurA
MQYFLAIFFSLLSLNSLAQNQITNQQKPLPKKEISRIIVNNKIITKSEIDERFEFLIKTSELKFHKNNQSNLWRNMIAEKMVEEELILQKAKFYKIEISQDELNSQINNFVQKKYKNLEKFKLFLQKNDWNFANFQKQIEAQLIWKKIVDEVIKPPIDVTIIEIKEWLEKEKIGGQNDKYLLQDFVIENSSNSQEFINKLHEELLSKDNFKDFIGNFLVLKSNINNQNTNWFWSAELNQKIHQAVSKINIDDYSEPVLLDDGWHIFKLIDKRNDLTLNDKEYDFVKSQITNRKVEVAIKNYLQDLKKRAFIQPQYSPI